MSPATAVARVAAELVHQTALGFAVAFTPDKARVGGMRRVTAAHLLMWKVPGPTAEDIVLAVSELVTNAIEHGCGDIELTMLHAHGEVMVEVADGNPAPAKLTVADDEDVSGRGLFLVAALAQDWGVSADGRSTWCVFHVPARRS